MPMINPIPKLFIIAPNTKPKLSPQAIQCWYELFLLFEFSIICTPCIF